MGIGYEELKARADELGYALVKKVKYIRFKPCICGHNYREKWFKGDTMFFKCKKCGLKSKPGKNEQDRT